MSDMTIPRNVWEQLQDEYNVRNDYSGRGMYGETCFGVSGADEFTLGVIFHRLMGDTAVELANRANTDTLGRGTIVYFPGVKLEDFVEYEDDEDEW